jgi:hypothetical protein
LVDKKLIICDGVKARKTALGIECEEDGVIGWLIGSRLYVRWHETVIMGWDSTKGSEGMNV